MKMRVAAIGIGLAHLIATSAWAEDSYRQEFPFPKAAVYQALVETLPTVGFKIKAQDSVLARVAASDGVSWTSLGENLSMSVVSAPEGSAIEFASAVKGKEGVFFRGKNQKNFDKVMFAVSKRLQSAPASVAEAAPSPPP